MIGSPTIAIRIGRSTEGHAGSERAEAGGIVSAEPSTHIAGWDGIRDCLGEIRAGHRESGRFFADVFDQLDAMLRELVRKQEEWRSERSRAESELARQAAELQQQRAEIVNTQDQIRQDAQQQVAGVAVADVQQVREILQEVERDRAALRSALEFTGSQADSLAGVASELAQTRSELVETRREILLQREKLEVVRTESDQTQTNEQIQDQLRRAAEERAEMELERRELETELETVRRRAAEISEAFEQQKRQMAEQQAQWTEELRRQRHLLESVTDRLGEGGSTPAVRPQQTREERRPQESPQRREVTKPEKQPDSTTAADDSVLDSVMAQFEVLQKDLARRRRQAAGKAKGRK